MQRSPPGQRILTKTGAQLDEWAFAITGLNVPCDLSLLAADRRPYGRPRAGMGRKIKRLNVSMHASRSDAFQSVGDHEQQS